MAHSFSVNKSSAYYRRKVAVAPGAGYLKVWDGLRYFAIRSLVTEDVPSLAKTNQLHVTITDSPHQGTFAIGENLEQSLGLLSIKDGLKAEWFNRMTLAAIAQAIRGDKQRDEDHPFEIELLCSVPTDEIRNGCGTLKGKHKVQFFSERPINLDLQSVIPRPEGMGAAMSAAKGKPVAITDIGHQNVTILGYDPNAPDWGLIDVQCFNGGVGDLFERIADMSNATGDRASEESIRKGIMAGTFEFYGHSGRSFKDAYDRAFTPWLKGIVNACRVKGKAIFAACPDKYFAGGGSLLPGIKARTEELGVGLLPNPQEAEVRGLFRL